VLRQFSDGFEAIVGWCELNETGARVRLNAKIGWSSIAAAKRAYTGVWTMRKAVSSSYGDPADGRRGTSLKLARKQR